MWILQLDRTRIYIGRILSDISPEIYKINAKFIFYRSEDNKKQIAASLASFSFKQLQFGRAAWLGPGRPFILCKVVQGVTNRIRHTYFLPGFQEIFITLKRASAH